MTPVEEFDTAIGYLTSFRDQGSAGSDSWSLDGNLITFEDNNGKLLIAERGNWGAPADMKMIVIQHATIDSQVAILRMGRDEAKLAEDTGTQVTGPKLQLAIDINTTAALLQ